MKEFKSMFKLNLQHFATPVNPGDTTMKKKHLGIVEKVTAAKSYSTPAVISNDAIYLQGRSFTVMKGDTTDLQDYNRQEPNTIDNVKIEETEYFLDQEKFWGRYVDRLDKRDTEGNIDVDYVVARQASGVVAPYLDNLRFGKIVANREKHISLGSGKEAQYNAVLDVSVELDEAGADGGNRVLFVTPTFYKGIKQYVVGLPQGDNNQQVLGKGVQGELDGFIVVKVPSTFMQGVQAIATVGEVLASPIQVDATQVIEKQEGRFGETVQQLLYTGAFVPKHLQSKIFTIGGTAPTQNRDGEDVHAPEDTGTTT